MGNPDKGNAIREIPIIEKLADPPQIGEELVMYDYDLLRKIPQESCIKVTKQLQTKEMEVYLRENGFTLPDSKASQDTFLYAMRGIIQEELLTEGYKADVGVGKPVMIERIDSVDPRRVLNIIFAVGESKAGNACFFTHPVELKANGELVIAPQRRTDTGVFQPPIWIVSENNLFGNREEFPMVVSYKCEKK